MQSGTARTCRSTNARNEEKTFSRNGDPARSVGFAATPAVSSGGRTTIRLWRKTPVVRMLRAGAAYGTEKVLQPCLLSQSHGGNAPPAGMRVVRRRLFSPCRGRTPVLLPELRQCRPNCAKEFPQDSSYRTGELDTLLRTNSLIWPLITSSFS